MNTFLSSSRTTIFGATGKVGKELTRLFVDAGLAVQCISRNPEKAPQFPGVTWIKADLLQPDSLAQALRQTDSLFLATTFSEELPRQCSNLFEAALRHKVRHIVDLSTKAAKADNPFPIARLHYEGEQILRQSGLGYTILRPTAFMQNWLGAWSATVKRERKIYEPAGDARLSFVDTRDIAAVAFEVLRDPAPHQGRTYELTTGKLLSYYYVAQALGQAIGEKVTYIPESAEEARSRMQRNQTPAWAIDLFLGMAKRIQETPATLSASIEEVLGRKPITVDEFARDYRDWFTATP